MENKTKFKVGDRVRVIESENKIINTNFIGKEGIIIDSSDCYYVIKGFYRGDKEIEFDESELELIPKTLENLEVGDIVIKDNCKARILSATGEGELRVYGMSCYDYNIGSEELKKFSWTVTAWQMSGYGYTPYTSKPEKTEREKLVEEYAKKVVMWLHGTGTVKIADILNEFADKLLK